MTLDEFRDKLNSYWLDVNKQADESRDSYLALRRMCELYLSFTDDERAMADRVLSEWVLSSSDAIRYDAIALIDEFQIVSAVPSLLRLTKRLTTHTTPSAPFELEKVNRVLKQLRERDLSHF